MPLTRVLLCLALLAAAGAAQPQAQPPSTPEAVYRRLHAAGLTGNYGIMMEQASARRRAEIEAMPNQAAVIRMLRALLPKAYKVAEVKIDPDGRRAVLHATATHAMLGPPQPYAGTVNLVREGTAWKVDRWEWTALGGSQPPPTSSDEVRTTDAIAPPDPAEAKRRAGIRRAQAERRKRLERESKCVIKPVMSDQDRANCR